MRLQMQPSAAVVLLGPRVAAARRPKMTQKNVGERGWSVRPPIVLLAAAALLILTVALQLLDLALPPPTGKLARSSPVVVDRNGAWLRALTVENGRWRLRADLDRTDPVFLKRLTALEDARFALHPGVDPLSIARAAAGNLRAGSIGSGGSTLTMQLARRLDPRPRTLGAKALEAVRALQLEARFSKREILADYLTLTPYGGALEGVRAASLAYFGHEPSSLTNGEQALLIALPQAPEARRPDRHPAAARRARAKVLDRLVHAGLLTRQAAREAGREPLPRRSHFPSAAWDATGELARAAPPAKPTVVSTLDASLQRRLEALAAQTANGQGDASSAAVLVIETRTRAVRAAVTSAGHDRAGGWVDATRALRSPGSALKPFLYAAAFEQGLAAPETTLADAPVAFEGYRPENFDHVFHGEVTAREALQYSLNIPAVTLLSRVGPTPFEARLRNAGAQVVRPREGVADAGLALALGGEGITLRDLALLYAALGDGGVAKPLAWTKAQAEAAARDPGRRLVRAEAAAQVLDILRESPPPADRPPPALSVGAPRLAFKTGTSYGFRDAVAAGIGDGWTVVVWTGRPDGGSRPGLTGRDAALPLLFAAFDLLEGDLSAPKPLPPPQAPRGMVRLPDTGLGPTLIFPPNGAQVIVDGFGPASRGLALSARGDHLHWYVDGRPLAASEGGGDPVWRPGTPGSYLITAVDRQGASAKSRIRVRGSG